LLIGSDDQTKVYLNGKPVDRWSPPRSWTPDSDIVTGITVNAGLNTLDFKVVNVGGDWSGSILITDANSQPVPGLSVTLDPEANE
jgi:hypothetical protein